MAEFEALCSRYSHLKDFPRQDEALHTLKKIASLVKPIMRARNWRVGILTEFYPDQQNLLGLNVNHGQKICLRLRYPGDRTQFLPLEQVVDTMLHELAHNVHGPHDEKFHALWDQLRKEHESLVAKGYTGEGFLSEGRKLGGQRIPRDEARRIARNAAEKRRTLYAGSGQRLGGAPVRVGTDIRKVIVDAIERRNTVLKGCGAEDKTEREIIDLSNEATANGFQTKAQEDEANERAIAQALWELVQEDEKNEYGKDYIKPTPDNPTGNGGGKEYGIKAEPLSPSSSSSKVQPRSRGFNVFDAQRNAANNSSNAPSGSFRSTSSSSKPTTTGFRSNSSSKSTHPQAKKPSARESQYYQPLSPQKSTEPPAPTLTGWTCEICTLHNPINFLCCDACTTERPDNVTQKVVQADAQKKKEEINKSKTWTCSYCTRVMESQWWTCGSCGMMKDSS